MDIHAPDSRKSILSRLIGTFRNPLAFWQDRHFEELTVVTRMPVGRLVATSDPDLIAHVLQRNASNYRRDLLQRRMIRRTIGQGPFGSEGERWRVLRKLMNRSLTPAAVADRLSALDRAASALIDRLAADPTEVELFEAMSGYAVDCTLNALMAGATSGETPVQVAASIREFSQINGPLRLTDLFGLPEWPTPARRQMGRTVTARAEGLLGTAGQPAKDTPTLLQTIRDALAGGEISEREACDTVSTLLGAGSETTAAALAWTIWLLAGHPEAMDAVTTEADQMASDEVTPDTLDRLIRTRAALDEAMRLFPPAPLIGRSALQADEVGGIRLRRGDTVLIAPWVLHRHRRLWERPDRFDPQRFLPDARKTIPRFAYLPFGAGPLQCPGAGLARAEMLLCLARLFARFRVEPLAGPPPEMLQRITLQARNGLTVCLIARGDAS